MKQNPILMSRTVLLLSAHDITTAQAEASHVSTGATI